MSRMRYDQSLKELLAPIPKGYRTFPRMAIRLQCFLHGATLIHSAQRVGLHDRMKLTPSNLAVRGSYGDKLWKYSAASPDVEEVLGDSAHNVLMRSRIFVLDTSPADSCWELAKSMVERDKCGPLIMIMRVDNNPHLRTLGYRYTAEVERGTTTAAWRSTRLRDVMDNGHELLMVCRDREQPLHFINDL